jgi:hypothetical protein
MEHHVQHGKLVPYLSYSSRRWKLQVLFVVLDHEDVHCEDYQTTDEHFEAINMPHVSPTIKKDRLLQILQHLPFCFDTAIRRGLLDVRQCVVSCMLRRHLKHANMLHGATVILSNKSQPNWTVLAFPSKTWRTAYSLAVGYMAERRSRSLAYR